MGHLRVAANRMQLDAYAAAVPKIYGTHDQYRSVSDVWCHALHHGAAIVERIRKKASPEKLLTEIADFALWLFTTVDKVSGSPGKRKTPGESAAETLIRVSSSCSDLIWHRYPRVCHICYARRSKSSRKVQSGGIPEPCNCSAQGPDRRNKETKRIDSRDLCKFAERTRTRKPKTIDDWQLMFAAVFKANIEDMSLTEIGLHLMEELGEVSDAMVRMYSYTKRDLRQGEPNWRQLRLESQIADVFSWLFALVIKLNKQPEFRSARPVTLSEIIWHRYGSDRFKSFRCPFCDGRVCSCALVFVPATCSTEQWLAKFRPPEPKRRNKDQLKKRMK
jgi:NTP pyrophosphatase (non-canonical NTP hydrolase)